MEKSFLTLASLKNGAALELVDTELANVFNNILDPNTEPKAQRKVQLELVFRPGDDRETGRVTIHVKSVLAPTKPVDATVLFGRDENGIAVAAEHRGMQIGQHALPDMTAVPEGMTTASQLNNVTPLQRAQGAN